MLKQRIVGFAGIVVGVTVVIISSLNYLSLKNLCAHTLCPSGSYDYMTNDEYLIVIALIVVGMSAALLFINERTQKKIALTERTDLNRSNKDYIQRSLIGLMSNIDSMWQPRKYSKYDES